MEHMKLGHWRVQHWRNPPFPPLSKGGARGAAGFTTAASVYQSRAVRFSPSAEEVSHPAASHLVCKALAHDFLFRRILLKVYPARGR
jgi:hypothetical protein